MTSGNSIGAYHNPRKIQRVYRSPSSPDEPSPYAKVHKETVMEIDAKDEEAGTILMALSQHAARIQSNSLNDEKPAARSNSMSIRNLLGGFTYDEFTIDTKQQFPVDNGASSSTTTIADKPFVRPYQSVSTGYKPYYEPRRRGFQICLTQRNTISTDEDMYHHQRRKQRSFSRHQPSSPKYHPVLKIKGNTAHIHISYRIHAHQTSLFETNVTKSTKTVHSSYPRPSHLTPYMDHYSYSYRHNV